MGIKIHLLEWDKASQVGYTSGYFIRDETKTVAAV